MLALGIRYLTGYAVATDVSNRELPEWPPHPARVYMAMAAAMFETGGASDERYALEWLEAQIPPALKVSEAEFRSVLPHFVPVNDAERQLQCIPIWRERRPRFFPRVRPVDDTAFLVWPDVEPTHEQRLVLQKLCEKVTRIGHSSSLVHMWLESEAPACNLEPMNTGVVRLRVVGQGTLEYLSMIYREDDVVAYAELTERIQSANGAEKKRLKEELDSDFGGVEPTTVRPTISHWQAYGPSNGMKAEPAPARGTFSTDLVILTVQDGPVVGLESTWALCTALHKTMLAYSDPTPEWLSGHQPDGSPSQQPHVALFPLAFVGGEHADGHLMGVALAVPHTIDVRERGKALSGLLYDADGRPQRIELVAGCLGAWTLARETRPMPPITLLGRTWTGASDTWASVTPVVLDRHPKIERAKDMQGWTVAVAEIVAESCERQGLPRPIAVDVDKTSWHRGAPRAVQGKSAGFPLMPVKNGQSSRQQVHVWLRFDRPVEGPLLIGAGRYRGYGVFKPWNRG